MKKTQRGGVAKFKNRHTCLFLATLTAKAKIHHRGKIISLEAKGVDKKLKSETGENINLMTKKTQLTFTIRGRLHLNVS